MDLTIAKSELLPMVARCQGAISPKSPMPAFANVWISVNGGTIDVSATDGYLGASSGADLTESSKPDTIGVHGRDLLERVKALPDGGIRVQTKKSSVLLSAMKGSRSFTLPCMSELDKPSIDDAPDVGGVIIPAATLSTLIDRTHYAISTDTQRAHVNSAMIEIVDGVIRVVTTNGHMLATATAKLDTSPADMAPILVPLAAVSELRKLLANVAPTDSIRLVASTDKRTAFFSTGGVVFSTRLVDAQFPPWRQVIPSEHASLVTVTRAALADAVRAVAVASEKGKAAVSLDFKSGTIEIRAGGDAFDSVPCELDGKPLSVGVNYGYVLSVLDALDSDEVGFKLGSELDPIVVNAPDFVAVVMPMRV